MVRGLDRFRQHFGLHVDQYILIGGTACDVRFSTRGMDFRVTTDLDIILIVETLSAEFVRHFWEFIRMGGYRLAEVNGERRFYRFKDPDEPDFPRELELFSRHPDSLPAVEGIHITDIPTGQDVSSLSAILLDDDYYNFTLKNCEVIDGVRVPSDVALIALKAKAFLSNRQRKADGQSVRTIDIVKHRNDVIRLAVVIERSPADGVNFNMWRDMTEFVRVLGEEQDTVRDVLKETAFRGIERAEIVEVLRVVFNLAQTTTNLKQE
jgi:hypothetical protein